MTDNTRRAVAGRRETKSIVFVLSLFIDLCRVKLLSSADWCQTRCPTPEIYAHLSWQVSTPDDYQKRRKSFFSRALLRADGSLRLPILVIFFFSIRRQETSSKREEGRIGRTKSHGNLSELTWTKRFSPSPPMSCTILMCVCTLGNLRVVAPNGFASPVTL